MSTPYVEFSPPVGEKLDEPVELAYVLTVQYQSRPGVLHVSTGSGTYEMHYRRTRHEIFKEITNKIAEGMNADPASLNVMFFSLERNEI